MIRTNGSTWHETPALRRRSRSWRSSCQATTIPISAGRTAATAGNETRSAALGLREQLVFPEIDYDRVDAQRGMDIVIVTTAKTDAEAKALLKGFDMPFAN